MLSIRRTICCCPACRSLNLIFSGRNQVLIVPLTCRLLRAESNGFLSEMGGPQTVSRMQRRWMDGRLIEGITLASFFCVKTCRRIASRQCRSRSFTVCSRDSYWQVTKTMHGFETQGRDLHQHCSDYSELSLIWTFRNFMKNDPHRQVAQGFPLHKLLSVKKKKRLPLSIWGNN